MPPKAEKGEKKKEVDPNVAYLAEQQLNDEIILLTCRLSALKKEYMTRMDTIARLKMKQIEQQQVLNQKQHELKDKSDERSDILTDSTRQMKTDEREAISQMAVLSAALHRLNEEKTSLQHDLEDQEHQYDKNIKAKRQQLEELSRKSSDMEREFTAMLADIEQSMHRNM